jgi:hypothetical protein
MLACCNGRGVYQGIQPDFVTMWHELMGETLKFRSGYQYLQRNATLDSTTGARHKSLGDAGFLFWGPVA